MIFLKSGYGENCFICQPSVLLAVRKTPETTNRCCLFHVICPLHAGAVLLILCQRFLGFKRVNLCAILMSEKLERELSRV